MSVRILTIMGSGETAPTMVTTHRDILRRVASSPTAVLLDTPFGFQANAADLSARAIEYFKASVGQEMTVASFRNASEIGSPDHERMLSRLRQADYVFAGPGSPSYALRQWRGSQVPEILATKLEAGGAVTFSSAAALTVGCVTVPVYEVYKVGEDPHWLEGLDLLATAGLNAAVVPHYNNAEGGNHDTRFCYLGEDRLRRLEGELPDGAFVLGVDEHTGIVFDLDAGHGTVVGLGVVTVRVDGRSTELASGTTVSINELAMMGRGDGASGAIAAQPFGASDAPLAAADTAGGTARSPLLDTIAAQEQLFDDALAARNVDAAVGAVLDLEAALAAWGADTLQSDELDRARAALRSMVVRLGELATTGARDPSEAVAPFVEALLDQRASARATKRYDDADVVRDRLVAAGVEVKDSPEGTSWRLLS